MKIIGKRIKIVALVAIVLGTVGFATMSDREFEMAKNLDIYHTLFRELSIYYVDEIDYGELVTKSIDEMLKSLDPYTVYIPESDIEDYNFMTTGQYGGIGAYIHSENEKIIVSEVISGSPACVAGVKAGDIIVAIDGNRISKKNSEQVSELLKGQPNSKITISVETPFTGEIRKIDIVRKKIKVKSVPYYGIVGDNIGYIKLLSFTENCSQEVKEAIVDLKTKHSNLAGIIFDLRGNPGGLLNEAVSISNFFVEKGSEIVSTKGKVKVWNKTYYAEDEAIDTQTPLVVLVNSGSASASEIVSGVIQDWDRGVIVGTRTYGKGLVQSTRDLSFNTKLKLTTAKYYIPSGRCIQALDYSHRNEDGSVGKIPDSLITKFNTKVGREVYDGGGVLPDIIAKQEVFSKISYSLYSKNLIFDYATLYSQTHKTIVDAKDFKLSDKEYKDFVSFLADKNYDYELESEKIIDQLETVIKSEKYEEQVGNELDKLRAKLAHDKERDLFTFKDEICKMLEAEIASRYYYLEGRIKSQLSVDPVLVKAISVLNDKQYYNSLLQAPKSE